MASEDFELQNESVKDDSVDIADSHSNERKAIETDESSSNLISESIEIDKKKKEGKEKSRKKQLNSMAEEVHKAEEKLKAREMTKLTILSIELSDLPSVHRFTKNVPWLQGSYGRNYSWVADYRESGTGDKATWADLQVLLFTFIIIIRNCSYNLITFAVVL